MRLTRRRFLESSIGTSAGISASRLLQAAASGALPSESDMAAPVNKYVVPAPDGEWMAATHTSEYRAYYSKSATNPDVTTWVQVDLGESRKINCVKLYPGNDRETAGVQSIKLPPRSPGAQPPRIGQPADYPGIACC